MSTEMASDNWRVVCDVIPTYEFRGLVEPLPENEPPYNLNNQPSSSSSLFLIDFNVVIRLLTPYEAAHLLEDVEISRPPIVNKASIDIDLHGDLVDGTLSETLRRLQVPAGERDVTVEGILFRASEIAKDTGATTKRMHMVVTVDFYARDDDNDDDDDEEFEANGGVIGGDYYNYEPRFVPVSTSSISKLKRKRVGVESEVCAVCLDEMTVGVEATTMPCGHFYHEACIVGWLKQSGVCPLCKFRMPENEDGVNSISLGDM